MLTREAHHQAAALSDIESGTPCECGSPIRSTDSSRRQNHPAPVQSDDCFHSADSMREALNGRSTLTLQSRAYAWPTVLFLAAGFALANGMGYGCGNLRQYLLHALRALDPTFLANDWFTTQTRAHHATFNTFIVLVGKLVSLDIFFAAANAVFAALFVICIYVLASRLYRAPILVTAIAVLCWAFGPPTLIGMTAIVNVYFQPSTIGAVGLLAGLTSMICGRYRLAGLVLGVAALFHINYMVWIIVILSIVVALNLRTLGWRQAAFLTAPAVLAAAYHLPFFIAGKSPEQAACSAAAARILHDIYMPYHSRPLTWGITPFLQFGAVIAAGLVSLMTVGAEMRPNRIAMTTLGAIAGIVLLGTIFTTAVQIDAVALLFPIRLSPFLVLAATITTSGAIVTTARSAYLSPVRTLILWLVLGTLLYCGGSRVYGLLCLGAAAAALFAGRLAGGKQMFDVQDGRSACGTYYRALLRRCRRSGHVARRGCDRRRSVPEDLLPSPRRHGDTENRGDQRVRL